MKKIFGYIFLVLGVFFGLSLVVQLPKMIIDIMNVFRSGTSNDFAYIMGQLSFFLVFSAVIFLLIRVGLKWISKKDTTKEIHDIGRK